MRSKYNLSEKINKESPKRDIVDKLNKIGLRFTKTDAYGWGETNIPGIYWNKDDNWSGWFNDYYNFGTFFVKTSSDVEKLDKIINKIKEDPEGLKINKCYTAGKYFGYSIGFPTMTKDEVDSKADSNLRNGGRMSDSINRVTRRSVNESVNYKEYAPTDKQIEKLSAYKNKGSMVNVKAIKADEKLFEYYYAACEMPWEELKNEIRNAVGNKDSDRLEILNDIDDNVKPKIKEDTVKQKNGKWVNKGDSGKMHGQFKTKKSADAQRKAMFANGYKIESLLKLTEEEIDTRKETIRELRSVYNELSSMLIEGANADVKDNIKKAFSEIGGDVRVSVDSPSYIRYSGKVYSDNGKDYSIRGSVSLDSLYGDLNMLAEDLTMAYFRTRGYDRQFEPVNTPMLMKLIGLRK